MPHSRHFDGCRARGSPVASMGVGQSTARRARLLLDGSRHSFTRFGLQSHFLRAGCCAADFKIYRRCQPAVRTLRSSGLITSDCGRLVVYSVLNILMFVVR